MGKMKDAIEDFWDGIAALEMETGPIVVSYRAVDGYNESKSFTRLEDARAFAVHWVGERPDIGRHYAVSFDGVGIVSVSGITLQALFGEGD